MKCIGNTILTRKAFRDMGLFEEGKRSPNQIILSESSGNRWLDHTCSLRFIDNCLLPANKDGSYVCLTTDIGRAKSNNFTGVGHCSYVLYKRSVLKDSASMTAFIKSIVSAHPNADLFYFENLEFYDNSVSIITFLEIFKKNNPTKICLFRIRKEESIFNKLLNSFGRQEANMVVSTTHGIAFIKRAVGSLSGQQYIHLPM